MDGISGVLIAILIIAFLLVEDRISRKRRKRKLVRRQAEIVKATDQIDYPQPSPARDRAAPQPQDHWEGGHWDVVETFSVVANLHIKYRDGAGQITERAVQVRSVGDYMGNPTLVGQCLLRNQPRTFRLDRILECFNEDTGEVVLDVYEHLEDIYESSPAGSLDAVWDKEFEALRMLYYIAKADGRLMPKERDVIASYCRAVTGDERIDAELIRDYVDSFGNPSLNTYKIAVGRVARRPEAEREVVRQAAQTMLAHRKKMSAVERDALDYIDERYAKEAPRETS